MQALGYALLTLLRNEECYGYRLLRLFEERTASVWSLNAGQLYQSLHRMEAEGFVVGRTENGGKAPSRRLFRITAAGEKALELWLRRRPQRPKPFRDELLIRLMHPDVQSSAKGIEQVMRQEASHRKHLAGLRAQKGRSRRQTNDRTRFLADIAAEAARLRAEAHLTWLAYCRSRLEERGRHVEEDSGPYKAAGGE